MIRRRYIFKGRVQHVGFRYTAERVASHEGLTGYVHNNYDGSVEAEIQGEDASVLSFPGNISSMNRFIDIEDVIASDLPLETDETSFRIR